MAQYSRGAYALMIFTIICLSLGATIGLILHYTLPREEPIARTDTVGSCIPQGEENEDLCEERECVWQASSDGAPWCTFPDRYGYVVDGEPEDTPLGTRLHLERIERPTLFDNDLEKLTVDIEYHSENRVRIKIADPQGARYQVPQEAVDIVPPSSQPPPENRLYDVEYVTEPQFGFKIKRRMDNTTVFDTSLPGLIFSNQYIQITTRLSSGHVYGFGEHNHRQFHHDMNWRKWSIFTRDVAPVDEWNLYGAQPFYMNIEEGGNANGVLLFNSNAMDIVLQPDEHPGISYHVIGGILDFYIFLGPTPENVVQQYTEAVGRPIMPPYWSLGFQLSRWDYDNLTHVRTVVDRNRDAGIPQDVQYGDIDYMESKLDFTYDRIKYAGLPEFVDELHERGQRYIIILDHCIGSNETLFQEKLNGSYPPYYEGLSADIFIKDGRNPDTNLEGEVWPGPVVYPDFTLGDNTTRWWTDQCEDFYYNQGVEYDALWIDMNEPSNFVPGSLTGCERNELNFPPYIPRILGADSENPEEVGRMFDKTICMDSLQKWGLHYDVHSLYGHSMSITTYLTLREMFPNKRPLVLTRSQFTGSQKYSGHWLGDNQSLWEQIPWSIVGMLEYSLFGYSYIGADICGFWYATTEEMCQRWTQLGAFYPYARNHNGETWPDQDPAAFSDEMIEVSRDILLTRYKLLPYLYSLIHDAHAHGSTVVRPLLHEFPADKNTYEIDRQFLWGPGFMISPAMEEGQTYVYAYFPEARWYDYYGGKELENVGETKNLSTPLDKINLHVRGGHVIPWQTPDNTTVFSRRNTMGLIVALGASPRYEAHGTLFWDDGESFETYENGNYLLVEFTCADYVLDMKIEKNNYTEAGNLVFKEIEIWGLDRRPVNVRVDDEVLDETQVQYDGYTKATRLIQLELNITVEHRVTWDLSRQQ